MDNKLEFTLVPLSGTLSESDGYRAKFGRTGDSALGFDTVIREAKEDGAFFGVSDELMKHYVRGILQSMIDHTAQDGITRRIDDFFSVSLKVHGKFDSSDEDFDPEKHKLALVLKPLNAFRPKFKLRPVNKDHKRQFRIYSISDSEGLCKSGHVLWQRDFTIVGDDMLPESGMPTVTCHMKGPDGFIPVVNPEIVSATAKKIVCHWPREYGEGFEKGRMCVSVDKPNYPSHPEAGYTDREKFVTVGNASSTHIVGK